MTPGSALRPVPLFSVAAPSENLFKTFVGRGDYSLSGAHRLFGRVNVMRDLVEAAPQFPGQPPASTDRVRNWGDRVRARLGARPDAREHAALRFTQIAWDSAGRLNSDLVWFRKIDPLAPQTPVYGRSAPTHNITNDFSWVAGSHRSGSGATCASPGTTGTTTSSATRTAARIVATFPTPA